MEQLKAGFHRIKITPPLGLKVPGYYTVRISDGIHDDLFCNAVAFEQGQQRVVFLSLDCIGIRTEAYEDIRDLIAERWERFARRLHARRPDVPILFVEPCHTPPFETEMVARGRLVRAIHDKLRAEDPKAWANLYLITDREQIPDDPEATADGVHPSDLGMSYMGRAFADRIVRILRGRD